MWRWLNSPPQKHHWLLLAALLMVGFFAVIFLPRRHPLFPLKNSGVGKMAVSPAICEISLFPRMAAS
ncbi:hypothetical protein [Fervidibacter sp.]|jgi:hypothetical protein